MDNFHSGINHLNQTRVDIHNEVRQIHLANQIHRINKAKQANSAGNWLHILSRLHRIRIHISFDLEEPSPSPEIKGAGC